MLMYELIAVYDISLSYQAATLTNWRSPTDTLHEFVKSNNEP